MYLCDPCHKQGGCMSFMEMRSYGRCENCGNTDHCVDCHHYNFSGKTNAQIEADVEKALAGVKCRYFVTEPGREEREVTKEMYVNVERSAGFHNHRHPNEPATASFGSSSRDREVKGRIEYEWPQKA